MENQSFSLHRAVELFDACPIVQVGPGKYDRNIDAVKNYIREFMFPIDNGAFYVKVENESNFIQYNQLDKTTIKSLYFDKMDKSVSDWFFKKNLDIYKVIIDTKKPAKGPNFINLYQGVNYPRKEFTSYSEQVQNKAKTFLN